MFLHDTHLPQILQPEHYTSSETMREEVEKLILPGWHLACSVFDLPNEGDFLTFELLGTPLIVWRHEDEFYAFLNVCPHRSCMLTSQESGCLPKLKCQYHGWEFDCSGNVGKIPDARNFRPLKPGMLGLRTFRTARAGHLVFVTLNDDAPSLPESLGPGYEMLQENCGGEWLPLFSGEREVEANWKVYIENTIETYHVEAVHPTTLRKIPDAETCEHELYDQGSKLLTHGKEEQLDWLDHTVHRLVGKQNDGKYHNLVCYPNFGMGKMSLFSWVDEVLPISPHRMKIVARSFVYAGRSDSWLRPIMFRVLRRWAMNFFSQLVEEDTVVMEAVQRGQSARFRPLGGLISAREERIFAFQKYMQTTLNLPQPENTWDSHPTAADFVWKSK